MTFIFTILPQPLKFILPPKILNNNNLYLILNLPWNRRCFVFRFFSNRHFTKKLTDISFLAGGFVQVFSLNPKAIVSSSWFLNNYSAQIIVTLVASASAFLLSHCCAPLRDAMTLTDYLAEIHTTLISHFSSCFFLVDP